MSAARGWAEKIAIAIEAHRQGAILRRLARRSKKLDQRAARTDADTRLLKERASKTEARLRRTIEGGAS